MWLWFQGASHHDPFQGMLLYLSSIQPDHFLEGSTSELVPGQTREILPMSSYSSEVKDCLLTRQLPQQPVIQESQTDDEE